MSRNGGKAVVGEAAKPRGVDMAMPDRTVSKSCIIVYLVLVGLIIGLPFARPSPPADPLTAASTLGIVDPPPGVGLLAVTFSGDGYRAMTGAIAVSRAMATLNAWRHVTSLGDASTARCRPRSTRARAVTSSGARRAGDA